MKLLLVLYVIVVESTRKSLSANILTICTVASPSHSLWCYQYMSALAQRGHKITLLGVNEPTIKIPNMTTYIVKNFFKDMAEPENGFSITDWAIPDKSKTSTIYPGFVDYLRVNTKLVLDSQALKDLINCHKHQKNPFDLVILDATTSYSLLGLVPLFGNPPVILATTYGSPQWMTSKVGNYFNPAYVPSMISPTDQQMTFFQRVKNLYYYLLIEAVFKFIMEPDQDKLMREVFGDDMPYVGDIARRSNLIIVNHHFALHDPRPLLPGVVGIAGLHIPEHPRPLPQEIKDFLDGATEGAILLSFGTNVKSKWFPAGFESMILKGLERLPQRVFWKWDKILPNVPKNVKMSLWLPQSDMMAHPNLRLFVTHCGLLSVQEAIFHKVQILAIPMFMDQIDNAAMLVRRNLSIQLNAYELTSDMLEKNINETLSNPMYKRNIEKLGELMRDLPQTARQQAVFWTEYVLRHQGAPHLRTVAADMPWYQLLLLDIIALFFIVLTVTVMIVYMVAKKLLSRSKRKTE